MHRLLVYTLISVVLILIGFSTWHLFAGNLGAAFSPAPFLLIIYLFVMKNKAT